MSIGSGISVSAQTANGLGRDIDNISKDELIVYQKASHYTAIIAINVPKLTVVGRICKQTALYCNTGLRETIYHFASHDTHSLGIAS